MLVDWKALYQYCEWLDTGIYAPGGMYRWNLHILLEPVQVTYHDGIRELGRHGVGTTHLDAWGFARDGDWDSAIDSYGTADNLDQIREHLRPFIDDPERTYIVEVDRIIRAEEPERGGFRPHKWGEYHGTGDVAEHEYFVDSNVDLLYHFCIFEVELPEQETA